MKHFKRKIKFNDYIYETPNQLSPHFCNQLIKKYEKNTEHHVAGVLGENNINLDVKQSEDLSIRTLDKFKVERGVLCFAVKKMLHHYANYLGNIFKGYGQTFYSSFEDSGVQIQRTSPGSFYTWHSDICPGSRYLTYLFYLNDVKKGGYTEFCNGRKIKARQGKGILFPASWDFVHRGVPPKTELKYIATGWLSMNYDISNN